MNEFFQVYKISEIKALVETDIINDSPLEFLKGKIKNGFIICWLFNRVVFGLIKDELVFERDSFSKSDLLELRAFNEKEELYLWKNQDGWKFRYIHDNDENGDKIEFFDAQQIMHGTVSKTVNNTFSEIYEQIGVKYTVPQVFLGGNELSSRTRLILLTRNYLGYNEIGQIGIEDSRIVKIFTREV